MAFSKENLSVHVKSEQVVEDNLRSWLVSVDARISGESVALSTVAKTVEVSCPVPDVEVECLGQPDQFTAIYRVHELNSNTELIDLPIKWRFCEQVAAAHSTNPAAIYMALISMAGFEMPKVFMII